jgi:HK97 gp10 family phage protein
MGCVMAGKLVVTGLANLKTNLQGLPEKLRRKVLVKALKAGAKVVLQAARQAVPVLATASPYRTPGLVKKRLTVRTSKAARQAGMVGVFVNVKPAEGAKYRTTSVRRVAGLKITERKLKKASQRGAKSKLDPYYWRWLEFGTKKMTARPFLKPAADRLPEALAAFEASAIPAIEAINKPGA